MLIDNHNQAAKYLLDLKAILNPLKNQMFGMNLSQEKAERDIALKIRDLVQNLQGTKQNIFEEISSEHPKATQKLLTEMENLYFPLMELAAKINDSYDCASYKGVQKQIYSSVTHWAQSGTANSSATILKQAAKDLYATKTELRDKALSKGLKHLA
jgi:hypothetical protein